LLLNFAKIQFFQPQHFWTKIFGQERFSDSPKFMVGAVAPYPLPATTPLARSYIDQSRLKDEERPSKQAITMKI